METLILRFAEFAERLTETAAIVIVTYGVVEALVHLAGIMARPCTRHGERKVVWRRFGVWLLLGLEFELAADISAASCRRRGRRSVSSARSR